MGKKQWILISIVGVFTLLVTPFFVVESAQQPYVRINRGSASTNERAVTLYILGPADVEDMQISNNESFTGASWERYNSRKDWTLDYGRGTQKVYIRFRNSNNKVHTTTYSDAIYLSVPSVMTVDIAINDDDTETNSRYVTVQTDVSRGVERVRLSENSDFSGASWVDVRPEMNLVLSAGGGTKKVYAQFWDANNKQLIVSDTIYYDEPPGAVSDRSILQGQGSAVYYVGVGGKLHPFFNSQVYFSWYDNFSRVTKVSDSKLSTFQIGEAVCMRAGTWLVKFAGFSQIYIPETGCRLRPIYSEVEAYVLYGPLWDKRVAELPVYTRSSYQIEDPRAAATERADEEDRDEDGVEAEIELEYGSSDSRRDTDSDGLSDYEEIFFWYTDPSKADTDGDGFSDGREIMAGFSPLGTHTLGSIPNNTYTYGRGSIVRSPIDSQLYIVDESGYYRPLGRDVRDSRFTSNNFSARYVIAPPYRMRLSPISDRAFGEAIPTFKYPTTHTGTRTVTEL